MASNSASTSKQQKKMEFTPVEFDVNSIPPDAPPGEWTASIPRGKCKIQPTKETRFPMIIVPLRLEKTDEDGDDFQKAIGTELSVFLVFGGKNPRAEKMSKQRIRQFCEAVDVDVDDIPKKISDADDLEPFIRKFEGKKLQIWTFNKEHRETGEVQTEVRFHDPRGVLKATDSDDDGDDAGDDDAPASERQPRGRAKPAAKGGSKRR